MIDRFIEQLNLLNDQLLNKCEDISMDDDKGPWKLPGQFGQKKNTSASIADIEINVDEDWDLNDKEIEAMNQFKENDREIDDLLDKVTIGLTELNVKA